MRLILPALLIFLSSFQEKTISPETGIFVIYVKDFNNQKFFWFRYSSDRHLVPTNTSFVDIWKGSLQGEHLEFRTSVEIKGRSISAPLFPIDVKANYNFNVYLLNKRMKRTHKVEIIVLKDQAGFLVNGQSFVYGPLIDQF